MYHTRSMRGGGTEMTIEEVYLKYLEYVCLKCKPQSLRSIKSRFENYILPYFKSIKINQITALKYLEWQMEMQDKNFSYKYLKSLHYSMVSLFNFGITFLSVKKNIPSQVGNFKNSYETKTIECWNIEEFNRFVDVIDNFQYKVLFEFLYFTGARLGEALALNWNDLNGNLVFINKTISKENINGKRLITLPKTKKSIRTIHIDNKLMTELYKLHEYYNRLYGKCNLNFIFGGIKPLAPTTIERKKNNYCKLAGVKQIRIHDFRHSHATLLVENQIPINDISARLGHSNINFTLETYVHSFTNNEKRVLATLNSIHN